METEQKAVQYLACNDTLAELLQNLRTNQKAFFKSKPGTETKRAAFENSRRLEKELDNFLQERSKAQPTPELFT